MPDHEEHWVLCANPNCLNYYVALDTESHTIRYECLNLSVHEGICDKCGYSYSDMPDNAHIPVYIDYTAEKHKIACTMCDYITAIPRQQNHSFSAWTSTGSTQHKHTCDKCGRVVTQNHVWGDWLDYSSSQHRRTCSTCGQTATQAHNYSGYKYYSTTQHRKQCQTSTCGHYSTPVSHTFGSWSSYSSTQHRRKCSGCSYYAYANHSFNYSGGELVCSTCGYSKPYGN